MIANFAINIVRVPQRSAVVHDGRFHSAGQRGKSVTNGAWFEFVGVDREILVTGRGPARRLEPNHSLAFHGQWERETGCHCQIPRACCEDQFGGTVGL